MSKGQGRSRQKKSSTFGAEADNIDGLRVLDQSTKVGNLALFSSRLDLPQLSKCQNHEELELPKKRRSKKGGGEYKEEELSRTRTLLSLRSSAG